MPPSPLAESVASLRVAMLATPAHACVPTAIHALILACLARILGRLEDMIRAWQAGQLPPPTQRPRTARATPCARAPLRNTHRAASRERRPIGAEQPADARDPASCAPSHRRHVPLRPDRPRPEFPPRPPGTNAADAAPPLAHAPIRRRISLRSASPSHAHFIALS